MVSKYAIVLLSTLALTACGSGSSDSSGKTKSPSQSNGQIDNAKLDKALILKLVNEVRAKGYQCGSTYYKPAPAVKWNDTLEKVAYGHSLDMATKNYFTHDSQDGTKYYERISRVGYQASTSAENIGAGYNSVQSAINGWLKSTGHCENIMNANVTEMGVGYAYAKNSKWGHYWTMVLAKP